MKENQLKTPVLYIVFNRPKIVNTVFQKIQELRPQNLFVAADGPRESVREDDKNCEKVRQIVSHPKWDCDLHTLFRDRNVGCKEAISGAITWFFENVDQGIIIEEDCLPDSSFFGFSEQLLEQYRDNEKIMHIAGTNVTPMPDSATSYCFSRLIQVGASATWKRAWDHFDGNYSAWPQISQKLDQDLFGRYTQRFFKAITYTSNNPKKAYGPCWAYSCLANGGLSIIPKVNLIKNVGFGAGATHTKGVNHPLARLEAGRINLPLTHPQAIEVDKRFDEKYLEVLFSEKDMRQSLDYDHGKAKILRPFKKIAEKAKSIMLG